MDGVSFAMYGDIFLAGVWLLCLWLVFLLFLWSRVPGHCSAGPQRGMHDILQIFTDETNPVVAVKKLRTHFRKATGAVFRSYYDVAFLLENEIVNAPFWLVFKDNRIFVRTGLQASLAAAPDGTPVALSHLMHGLRHDEMSVVNVRYTGTLHRVEDSALKMELFLHWPETAQTTFRNLIQKGPWPTNDPNRTFSRVEADALQSPETQVGLEEILEDMALIEIVPVKAKLSVTNDEISQGVKYSRQGFGDEWTSQVRHMYEAHKTHCA